MVPTAPGWSSAPRPRVALAVFVRGTFDTSKAAELTGASRAALDEAGAEVAAVSPLLGDADAVRVFAARLRAAPPDLVVCLFATFVDGSLVGALAEGVHAPYALWALREEGGPGVRLALNSLTGAHLAAHVLADAGRPFRLVFGGPEEPEAAGALARLVRVAGVRAWLGRQRVLVLGRAPTGFGFADPPEGALQALGVRVVRRDLGEVFAAARALPEARWADALARARALVAGLDRLPTEGVEGFARLDAAVREAAAAEGATSVAVRCWPEFFTEFGAAACSFVSFLNEDGVAAACEADVLGAVTMGILGHLAGSPPYLGDLAAVDRARDAVVFWHCGAGAPSLAGGAGARAGVHPNRRLGFTLELGLRPGPVTVARLGVAPGGDLRLLVVSGEALDAPQAFLGTTATVRLAVPGGAEAAVRRLVEDGWEPHYALVHGDVRAELEDLAAWLRVPAVSLC